jgi:hypothetical protein
MLLRSAGIKARLSALEEYVGMPKECGGMTLTARIEAQHALLVALNTNQSDMNRRLTNVEERLTGVEGRLDRVEDTLGKVLWGVTEIKNMLKDDDGLPDDRGRSSSRG